jgi:16S rRNA (uracil1498-N3)-methyltransferase
MSRPPPDRAGARCFVPDAAPDVAAVRLPPDEAHHLTRVLRRGVGAVVGVFNGRGDEWAGRVTAIDRAGVTVSLDRRIGAVAEPAVLVTLAVGLLKGDQMDAVIRDATALGVHAIAPIVSAQVAVPRRAWQSGGPVERWRRIAVAAAKQCGRAVVPAVRPIAAFDAVIEAAQHDLILMALEPSASGLPEFDANASPRTALALVGPEGGWSQEEIARAAARGARAVRLGPRRLRADLAPAVLLASLYTSWGW